jgi:hypothetical protein
MSIEKKELTPFLKLKLSNDSSTQELEFSTESLPFLKTLKTSEK